MRERESKKYFKVEKKLNFPQKQKKIAHEIILYFVEKFSSSLPRNKNFSFLISQHFRLFIRKKNLIQKLLYLKIVVEGGLVVIVVVVGKTKTCANNSF